MLFCRCPLKCFESINAVHRQEVFSKFYGMETKNVQDVYLKAHIEAKEVSRRRNTERAVWRVVETDLWTILLIWMHLKESMSRWILKNTCNGRERLKRLQWLLLAGESPKDKRWKNIKENAIDAGVRNMIRDHIGSFSIKVSHYSNKEYIYLNARLNLKIMHDLLKRSIQIPMLNILFSLISIR